uniref:Dickkopf WNT signaling pathway inhibitor 2 n=1 Tax=Oryzias latipes TaxID=8090 RepID=A0A3B3IAA7_ORYLA
MLATTWNRCCVLMFLIVSVRTDASEGRPKENSIKSGLIEEKPTAATNRSAVVTKKRNFIPQQVYPCSNDKECSVGSYCHSPQQSPSRCLSCRRKMKRCNRDSMCCPGNRCSNYICVPVFESVLSPHIPALDEHSKHSTKYHSWRKKGKAQAKHSLKGKNLLCKPFSMFSFFSLPSSTSVDEVITAYLQQSNGHASPQVMLIEGLLVLCPKHTRPAENKPQCMLLFCTVTKPQNSSADSSTQCVTHKERNHRTQFWYVCCNNSLNLLLCVHAT